VSCLLPQDYKDDNHKPEMALALEDFEALCGFVSPAELKAVLQEQPEVRLCVGEEAASAFINAEEGQVKQVGVGVGVGVRMPGLPFQHCRTAASFHATVQGVKGILPFRLSVLLVPAHQPQSLPLPLPPPFPSPTQALKAAFTALMTAESDKVSGAISSLVARLNQEQEGGRSLSDKERLVLRLNSQYPNDVGVLSAFFLNQVGGWVRSRQPGGVSACYRMV
jgi:mannose-6-phosphate isomerase class I